MVLEVVVGEVTLSLCLDFTCPTDRAVETINIGAGNTFAFNTNDDGKYSRNMNCQVSYVLEASCQKIKMQCPTFSIANGDFLFVKKGNAKPIK